jgi:6-methylsalicylic acid synthase
VLGKRVVVPGSSPVSLWRARLDGAGKPYPGGHNVLGAEILPAAVVLATFLAAADGQGLAEVLLRVPVPVDAPRDVQVVRQDGELHLSSRLGDQAWLTHATALIAEEQGVPGELRQVGLGEVLDPGCVPERLREIGVDGVGFPWRVREVRRGLGYLVAKVDAAGWAALFEAGLSAAAIVFPGRPALRLPGRLRVVEVYGEPPAEALIGVRVTDVVWAGNQAEDAEVDVTIADLDGVVRARLGGARFAVVRQSNVEAA